MKRLLIVGLLLITSTAYGQIIEERNNETGESSYQTGLFPIRVEGVMEAKGGLVYTENQVLGLTIQIFSPEVLHLNDDVATFLIDGQNREFKIHSRDVKYDPTGTSFLTLEHLNFIIDTALLESIANADQPRLTIGSNAYEFSPTAKVNVRAMLEVVNDSD